MLHIKWTSVCSPVAPSCPPQSCTVCVAGSLCSEHVAPSGLPLGKFCFTNTRTQWCPLFSANSYNNCYNKCKHILSGWRGIEKNAEFRSTTVYYFEFESKEAKREFVSGITGAAGTTMLLITCRSWTNMDCLFPLAHPGPRGTGLHPLFLLLFFEVVYSAWSLEV